MNNTSKKEVLPEDSLSKTTNNYYFGDIDMTVSAPKSNNQLASVQNLLEKLQPQLLKALPKHLSPDRMTRIALTELRKVPKLATCDPMSFCGAIMMCAQLGLEPGGALGHIYLIPFDNRKKNTVEVQVIMGYRGMIELARRSGQIVSLAAHEVYENDTFEFEYGLTEKLRHVPSLADRGKLMAVYSVAHFVGGGHQIEVMSKPDVDKIRARSKSGNSGPWVTDYEEMAKKTVLRKLFKYLPVSIEKLQQATAIDEQADFGTQDTRDILKDYASSEDIVIDYNTGEVIDAEPVTEQADALADKLK
jgi:recombination protein RecT